MLKKYPLQQKLYRAWVNGHAEDESLGMSKNALECPLSCYLKETYGTVFQVTWDFVPEEAWYERMDTGETAPLPVWAQREAVFVDQIFELTTPVTRGTYESERARGMR